jgi:hypothetical protein
MHWLKPGVGGSPSLILATQETEIRRIEVRSQPRETVYETKHKKRLAEWLK